MKFKHNLFDPLEEGYEYTRREFISPIMVLAAMGLVASFWPHSTMLADQSDVLQDALRSSRSGGVTRQDVNVADNNDNDLTEPLLSAEDQSQNGNLCFHDN